MEDDVEMADIHSGAAGLAVLAIFIISTVVALIVWLIWGRTPPPPPAPFHDPGGHPPEGPPNRARHDGATRCALPGNQTASCREALLAACAAFS